MTAATKSKPLSIGVESLHVLADTGRVVTAGMSVSDWIEVSSHPRHRALPEDVSVVFNPTGSIVDEVQRQVAATQYRGRLYKLSGHQRARQWNSQPRKAPTDVLVTIYRATNKKDFDGLYHTFNPTKSGSQYDKVAGAMQECGLSLKSKRLRYGYILTALNIALRGASRAHQDKENTPPINVRKAVGVFAKELNLLDTLDPQPDVFYNGVIAAALIALTLYPDDAVEYFHKLATKQGSKKDGHLDPVEAILVHIHNMKKQRTAWITAQQEDLCGRTLRAFTSWRRGEGNADEYWSNTAIPSIDFRKLIELVRREKGITNAHDV